MSLIANKVICLFHSSRNSINPFARGTILLVPHVKERRVLNVCYLNFNTFDKKYFIGVDLKPGPA